MFSDYFELIMGSQEDSFLNIFNKLWLKELESHQMRYKTAKQLLGGNRLRPLLVAWGYYINDKEPNNEFVAQIAICVELIHKASILLDDLIDQDDFRHSQESFHKEFSQEETILYAIYLLNRSISIANQIEVQTKIPGISSILTTVIDNMAKGGLLEIQSNGILTKEEAENIINLETTPLIENSLYLGYKIGMPNIEEFEGSPFVKHDEYIQQNNLVTKWYKSIDISIHTIGKICGYMFQVMNDIEPFTNPILNETHKGFVNLDFNKKRKNMVFSLLYDCCSDETKNKLEHNLDKHYLKLLVDSYDLIGVLKESLNNDIKTLADTMDVFCNRNSYPDFKKFIHYLINECNKRCGSDFINNKF